MSATVHVRPSDPGHGLLLVVLAADDGTEWLASYEADALWKELADRRVFVTGDRYEPAGQALVMPHLRVETVRVVKPTPEDAIVEIGRERTFRGRFAVYTWPEHTKLAGESSTRFFDDDGKSYPLANTPAPQAAVGGAVEVRGRLVTPSSFSAHEGGPFLWVLGVAPIPL